MGGISGNFLRMSTLKTWDRFPRFQDIDDADFVAKGFERNGQYIPALKKSYDTNFAAGNVVHFISHRWHSPSHPDPGGEQLAWLKEQLGQFDDALIWYDYCCLPQEPRSANETRLFAQGIDAIPDLIRSSWFIVSPVYGDDYQSRAWCQFEAIIAQLFGARPPRNAWARQNWGDEIAGQTNFLLQKTPLYNTLADCYEKLPKDRSTLDKEGEELGYTSYGYWLAGYYLDVPDLNDPVFSPFKAQFFKLQASILADAPMLWELLRQLLPARRENHTYRGY